MRGCARQRKANAHGVHTCMHTVHTGRRERVSGVAKLVVTATVSCVTVTRTASVVTSPHEGSSLAQPGTTCAWSCWRCAKDNQEHGSAMQTECSPHLLCYLCLDGEPASGAGSRRFAWINGIYTVRSSARPNLLNAFKPQRQRRRVQQRIVHNRTQNQGMSPVYRYPLLKNNDDLAMMQRSRPSGLGQVQGVEQEACASLTHRLPNELWKWPYGPCVTPARTSQPLTYAGMYILICALCM